MERLISSHTALLPLSGEDWQGAESTAQVFLWPPECCLLVPQAHVGFLGKGSRVRGRESENTHSWALGVSASGSWIRGRKSTGKPSGDIPESEALGGEARDLFIAFFGQRRTGSSVGFRLMVPSGSPASGETFSVAPLSTFSSLLFLGSGFIWYWRDSEVPPLPTSRPAPSLGPQWPIAHRMVFRSRACETAS